MTAAGDQLGFWAGRRVGAPLLTRLRRDPARDKLLARAVRMMDRRGIIDDNLALLSAEYMINQPGHIASGRKSEQHVRCRSLTRPYGVRNASCGFCHSIAEGYVAICKMDIAGPDLEIFE